MAHSGLAVVRDRASERGKPGWASGLLLSWKIWACIPVDSHLLGLWGGDNLSSNEEVLWSRPGPSIHSRSTLLTHSSRSKGLRSHGTNQKELATGPTHHGSIGLLSEPTKSLVQPRPRVRIQMSSLTTPLEGTCSVIC